MWSEQEGMFPFGIVVCSKIHPIAKKHPEAKRRPFPRKKANLTDVLVQRGTTVLLPSPAGHEAMLGPQRGAGTAAVTPYRTSWDKRHLSSVSLTHLELSHLPATDARLGHQGTEGEAPAMATDSLPSAAHPDGISGWNELRGCWQKSSHLIHPKSIHPKGIHATTCPGT